MSKMKEREYNDYDDDAPALEEDDDLIDSDPEVDGNVDVPLLAGQECVSYRRTWRDTEKYKEMMELYKIINDELYTGFNIEEFLEEKDGS